MPDDQTAIATLKKKIESCEAQIVDIINSPSPQSSYHGVSWLRRCKKWQVKGVGNQYVGLFHDEKEAASAHDDFVRENPKPLNFPDDIDHVSKTLRHAIKHVQTTGEQQQVSLAGVTLLISPQ